MTTRDIVQIALFAALTAALALFPPLPLPLIGVPVTAQSMGPMLAGALLGARRGGLALLLFLVLVAAGLPLLSGGRGGFGVFFGPTAGFLVSWPIAAFVVGLLTRRAENLAWSVLGIAVGGIGVVYAIGLPWTAAVAHLPLTKVVLASVAFLPGDALKVVLTALVERTVRRSYPLRTARA